jgi:restriction system protein
MSKDLTYHFPPELFNLLVETIPILNPRKRDVVTFFRGAGVPSDITDVLAARLREDRNSVNKYDMARVVLDRLNSRGEATLRERREVLRRVVEFTNFESCWPEDRLKARGLVASVREVVNEKDAFTRMAQERDQERKARIAQQEALRRERQERDGKIEAAKKELYNLFSTELTPQERGKRLESALNNIFNAYGILVTEAFHLVSREGGGIVEQIDGVIQLKGTLYLVEMKWYREAVGVPEISRHVVRVMGRAGAHGIVISASDFTEPAVQIARDFLQQKILVLGTLAELVHVLEQKLELAEYWEKKIHAAQLYKNPCFNPFSTA